MVSKVDAALSLKRGIVTATESTQQQTQTVWNCCFVCSKNTRFCSIYLMEHFILNTFYISQLYSMQLFWKTSFPLHSQVLQHHSSGGLKCSIIVSSCLLCTAEVHMHFTKNVSLTFTIIVSRTVQEPRFLFSSTLQVFPLQTPQSSFKAIKAVLLCRWIHQPPIGKLLLPAPVQRQTGPLGEGNVCKDSTSTRFYSQYC